MKKSWHVVTYENQEKVFLARQKADMEKKRLAEIQKQLREERQMEDLRRIQVEAGLIPYTERLDWMYEGIVQSADAEEFLLGKPVDDKAEKESQISKLKSKTGALLMNQPEGLPSSRDQLAKLKEDPLMVMRRKELEQRAQILKNPLKKQRLMERLKQEIEGDKKHKKRDRHENRDKHEHRESRRRSRSRSRSRSPAAKRSRFDDKESRTSSSRHEQSPAPISSSSSAPRSSALSMTSPRPPPPSRPAKRTGLSAEEKARRLREMEDNAKVHDDYRSQRLKRYETEDRTDRNAEGKANQKPKFMADLNSSTYLDSKDTVYDKIKRAAHTRQRSSDSFLRHD
eukprot:c39614_g1_i1.p1 GENE.c39614_g1_i1~~c39614_g1_i1.p1  ORF type:complete len:368 (+),score=74.59 c39614_g1_i1:82-1104(+)